MLDNFYKSYYPIKGQKLLLKGKIEKAYQYFEKALLLENNATNLYNISLALLALGRRKEAQNYLEKVLELMPTSELVLLTLADLAMQGRDWKKAEMYIEKLILAYPKNTKYEKYLLRVKNPSARENYIKAKELLQKANALIVEKKTKEAIDALEKAEKYDPENPYIQNNLGTFYLQLEKNPKRALTYFQKAYQLEPDNDKFKQNLFYVRKTIKE
jgi:tetratricopeptide (TPR) repeat protein